MTPLLELHSNVVQYESREVEHFTRRVQSIVSGMTPSCMHVDTSMHAKRIKVHCVHLVVEQSPDVV